MRFECNFGTLGSSNRARRSDGGGRFRIALLGDFSGRTIAGKLETGEQLAQRKPLRVDIDNIDDLIERMGIQMRLPVGGDDAVIGVEIGSIDDFHPDELFENVEVFEELAALRARLQNDRTYASAADEVRDWIDEGKIAKPRRKKNVSRGTTVPIGGKLSDFAKLVGRPAASSDASNDVEDLLKRFVAPHISPDSDPDQEMLIAAVDEGLSVAMRSILHQPEFQSVESIWRGADFLVRRLETDASLQVVLYDVSAEEIAADLSSHDALEESGLYKLLVEQPALDAAQGSLAAILGFYVFDETPPHAELLGRIAKIAAAAEAPFVASVHKQCLDRKPGEPSHPLVVEAWTTLKELPEAKYLALTVPQFLLRLPYGKKSDPIDSFAFEEFTPHSGVSGMLWGNGVLLVGLMLGQTYSRQGLQKMQIGSVMSFDEMPYHFCTDRDGDQIALPCTDRLLSQRMAHAAIDSGYIPVLSIQGQPVVRLGSTRSIAGVELAGVWPASAAAAKMQAADAQQAAQRSAVKPRPAAGEDGFRDDLAWKMKDGTFEDDDDADGDDSDSLDSSGFDADDDLESGAGDDADETESSSGMDVDASDSDDDLDALLASLEDDGDSGDGDSGDGDSGGEGGGDDDEMDPELAALLADL